MSREFALLAAVLSLTTFKASALVYVEKEGFYIYFPEYEAELAAELTEPLPKMSAFLSAKGLAVEPPLHVVLDEQRDVPEVNVEMIPHKEIRIPIRAPGVLEDGYTEADPWAYFLFRGLCLQAIFQMRSGIPELLSKGFGEIVSPNRVLPPWVDDGICNLLYSLYEEKAVQGPLDRLVFETAPVPDLDLISHHPQVWPGYNAYRIYGRPFIAWLYRRYGWSKILEFLQVHGSGVVPWEIDLKATEVFGKTGAALWRDFQAAHPRKGEVDAGLVVSGYWSDPWVYWNDAGVFPGKLRIGRRARYGYVDAAGAVWISEYVAGRSRIVRYANNIEIPVQLNSLWDPGPGRVAVARRGHRSYLVVFPDDGNGGLRRARKADAASVRTIPVPADVVQVSGPVRNEDGHIALAANRDGNWDIWLHDGNWHRLTASPSVELDPWWHGDTLVWASNATGKFQIQRADGEPVTSAAHGALLPRDGTYLQLTANGWQARRYDSAKPMLPALRFLSDDGQAESDTLPALTGKPYDPFMSLWPNYVQPDLFAAIGELQLGLDTSGRDVSGDYLLEAGARYSFEDDFVALQALFQRKTLGTRYARYPFAYETALDQRVSEKRNDVAIYWQPFHGEEIEQTNILKTTTGSDLLFDTVDLSLNWRAYSPLSGSGSSEDEFWLSLAASKTFESVRLWGNAELFSEDRQSVSGGAGFLFGDRVLTSLQLMAGRAWGEPTAGHTTFRIGGDLTEGFFTRRPTRLFPVRGFDSNLIEAPIAAAASAEVFFPLANLQLGYQSLPLFLHRLRLGTFVDAGYANVDNRSDDFLVGAGFELLTSLEVGWGGFSTFRIGVAWPVLQPDDIDQEGPVIVFQLGRPL